MSTPLTFEGFTGIDLRRNKESSEPRTLRVATNVDLTLGGGVKRRAGLRPVCTVDSQSKGLYAMNGTLRAVIPSGQSIPASATGEVQVIYDAIGTSTSATYSTGTVTVNNNNTTVTLASGTWPSWVDASSTFAVGAVTFSVLTRNSGTVITLRSVYSGVSASGLAYSIYGTQATAYPLSTISSVAAVEGVGTNAAFGQYPYINIAKTDGTYEHHWVTSVPPTITDAVKTKVNLPFRPGPAMIKLEEKLWADDNVNGVVRFSSTANGPSDWTNELDAGYLPVTARINGDRTIRALGSYDNRLAVFFEDALQLWTVAPDPALIDLDRVMNGPGTLYPNAVRNVGGDVFYFSAGGFRNITTVAITGQIKEDDTIGAPIYELTSALDPLAISPMAVWSQTRGQYICVVGSTAYVYRYSPRLKLVGWTTYDLGLTIDALVEFDGFVYLRSGTTVYRLDNDYDDGCTFTVQPSWTDGGNAARLTRYDFIELYQAGTCEVTYLIDPRDETVTRDGPEIIGTTTPLPLIAMGVCSQALSLVFTGTDPDWQLDRYLLYVTRLGR